MSTHTQHKVLILGSGMCTPALVHYMLTHNFYVVLGNRTQERADKLISSIGLSDEFRRSVETHKLDIESEEGLKLLDELVPRVEAVISMLPYLFHPAAARVAIKHKKHFFTTSYTSDFMRQLEPQAKELGLIIVNECGVDPGTDHMSAMRVIDHARQNGGKVVSFTSFTGGLPAPDSNNNPYGYKLSWAPRGVLLASRNDAHYLQDGKDVNIPGKDLFDNYHIVDIEGVGKLEAYPNRNSCSYIDVYGIKDTKTMLRGTYRYPGWCPTIKKLADLGFLDVTEQDFTGKSYVDLVLQRLNHTDKQTVRQKVGEVLTIPSDKSFILDNMEWIGLFSDKPVAPGTKTLLDALCSLFLEKLQYAPGERDMIVMRHEFVIEYADRYEHLSSTLIDYGIPNGFSSMSRTVSLPLAIVVRQVLEGKMKLSPGIHIPITPELYNPILDELAELGIKFTEKLDKVVPK